MSEVSSEAKYLAALERLDLAQREIVDLRANLAGLQLQHSTCLTDIRRMIEEIAKLAQELDQAQAERDRLRLADDGEILNLKTQLERAEARERVLLSGTVEGELRARLEQAQETIVYMRDGYSPFGARGCAICLYENGKFIRWCKLHKQLEEMQARERRLREALDELVSALDDAERRWFAQDVNAYRSNMVTATLKQARAALAEPEAGRRDDDDGEIAAYGRGGGAEPA